MGGSILWRSAPSFGRWRRGDGGVRAGVLGDEVCVGAQAIAGALDLDDDGVMQQPVKQRRGNGVGEDLTPLGEAAVGGQDHGALLVARVDELEEEIGAAGRDWQVADLVDDEQAAAAQEADLLDQAAFAFGTAERLDQLGQSAAVDPPAGLHRVDAKRGGEVGFSGSRWSEEVHDLGTGNEVELGQRHDAIAIEGGLEGEVEAF